MKVAPCSYRIPLPHLAGSYFCAHPEVHFPDGIVFKNACSVCNVCSAEQPGTLRPLPRQLRPTCDISPCYFVSHSSETGGTVNQCHHPAHHMATPEVCRTCDDYRVRPVRGSVRRWAVGLTTAPRRQPTFVRTVQSLNATGWSPEEIHVFAEPDAFSGKNDLPSMLTVRGRKAGAFSNWYLALQELVYTQPTADAYLMLQDDIVCCRWLRQYLEHALWPAEVTGFVSLYCGMLQSNCARSQGFVKMQAGDMLYGALAIAFSGSAARALLLHPLFQRHRESGTGTHGIDAVLAKWVTQSGLPGFVHSPSLISHTGLTSAIFSGCRTGPERRTESFVGENFDARSILG
jgi:hypothetical protein